VGPEGGLAPEELALLDEAGAVRVALGGHRLRAETAVVTLLAAALTALGELAPSSSPH
jgi:16S rRNA (uracil1498-N3)-methyltransferase